jgi:DNA-binding HxlR family transcriptional regulator
MQEGSFSIPVESMNTASDAPDFGVILHTHSCRQVAQTLSLIGNKWTVLVIALLAGGPCRFNELRRSIGGITQRSLTLTLRELEREGLITRTVFPSVPARVEYELTELGLSLRDPISALAKWVSRNQPTLEAARKAFDASHADTATRR